MKAWISVSTKRLEKETERNEAVRGKNVPLKGSQKDKPHKRIVVLDKGRKHGSVIVVVCKYCEYCKMTRYLWYKKKKGKHRRKCY